MRRIPPCLVTGCDQRQRAKRPHAGPRARARRLRIALCGAAVLGLLSPATATAQEITVTPSQPVVGQMTTFEHKGGLLCCTWTFGDGSPAVAAYAANHRVGHIYGTLGTYTVTASGRYSTTKGTPGESFTHRTTVRVTDPRDPTAPTLQLRAFGPIGQSRPHTVTAVDANARVQWHATARDADSSLSVLRMRVVIIAKCRNIISGGGFTANYGFDSQGLPSRLDPRAISHTYSLSLGEMITTAGQACQPPFSLEEFVGSVRAEAVNRFGATTKVAQGFRWSPRLNVIAYNLGGGTDIAGDGKPQRTKIWKASSHDSRTPISHCCKKSASGVARSTSGAVINRQNASPRTLRSSTPTGALARRKAARLGGESSKVQASSRGTRFATAASSPTRAETRPLSWRSPKRRSTRSRIC